MDKPLHFPTWQKILIEYYYQGNIKSVMRISSDLDMPVTHASHITRKMVECGLLSSSKSCPTDARINILTLTALGREIAEKLVEVHKRMMSIREDKE